MTDDKNIKQTDAAVDEWLIDDNADAENELFSELDQANIDALLSSDDLNVSSGKKNKAAEPTPQAAGPATATEENMASEFSQDDIDALLGGSPTPTAAKAAPPPAAEPEGVAGEFNQNDIDALLEGSPTPTAPPVSSMFEGSEEMGGDLTQDAIEALLSAPAAKTAPPPAGEPGELQQDDIDALFGSAPSPAAPATSRFDGSEEMGGDLTQDDIEALLGGGPKDQKQQAQPDSQEGIHEIDKSHLDALLKADTSSEISVGINALIGGDSGPAQGPGPSLSGVPSQEEMDKIFFEAMAKEKEKENKSDELFLDEMMGGLESESTSSGTKAFGLDEDDFKFGDDMPDIPADQEAAQRLEARKEEPPSPAAETPAAKAVKPKRSKPFVLPAWLKNARESRAIMTGSLLGLLLVLGTTIYYGLWHRGQIPVSQHVATQVKSPAPVVETVPPQQPHPSPPQPETMHAKQEAPKPEPVVANRPPLVRDGVFQIGEKSLGVPVILSGKDDDGDALTYQITGQPRFGAIYGEPPMITYVAGVGFPGQDMFEFTASDSHAASAPAVIRISGPDLTKLASAKPLAPTPPSPALPQAKPQKEKILAAKTAVYTPVEESAPQPRPQRDKQQPSVMAARLVPKNILTEEAPPSLPQIKQQVSKPRTGPVVATNDYVHAFSTEPVIIDWAEIWRNATNTPFTNKVTVVIEKTDLHGQLEKLSASRSRYLPEPFFVGEESIHYRFTVGKKRSKARRLELIIANGNPYPRVYIKPLEKEVYLVGETVELDASATRDDNRATLSFAWELVAGPTVRFKNVNNEGSVVRFQVPGVFAKQQASGLSLRVIAKDISGQATIQEVKIGIRSKRQSPLWGDMPAVDTMRLPACPSGDCSAPRLLVSSLR